MTVSGSGMKKVSGSRNPGVPMIIGIVLILCAFWMFVWRSALDGVFHFDDFSNIVDNIAVRQLWPLNNFLSSSRPLGLYSFALNHHFSGLNPFAYLVSNLGIHLTNGLLLFLGIWISGNLWRRIRTDGRSIEPKAQFRLLLLSSLIATLWTVHPITTQAVTYIVQRYEALASLGYLLAWVGLLVHLAKFRKAGCLTVLLGAWVGLLSKEIFATAPLVILLFDRLWTRQAWTDIARNRWLLYMLMCSPYVWFIPSVAHFFDPVRTSGGTVGIGINKLGSWEYLRTQPEILWHYVSLVMWPKDLCIDYDWKIQTNPWVYLPLGATIVAVLLLGGYLYTRGIFTASLDDTPCSECGIAGWLILTFFLILAPTSSVMPIADLAFEHRMYLASSVVLAGIVCGASVLASRLIEVSERPKVLILAFFCIVLSSVSLLSWRTHVRNLDYRDELTLWYGATRVSPQNARAWHTLGLARYNRGDKAGALQPLVNAVGLSNESVPSFDASLAAGLLHLKRYEAAITLYNRALSKKQDFPEVYNDLGVIYLEQGRLDDAQQAFETAISQKHPQATYNLALVHLRLNRVEEAVPLLEKVLVEQPELHVAARRLAWVFATSHDARFRNITRAERLLQQHYDVAKSQNGHVLDTWAAIQAAQGNFEAAIRTVDQALSVAQSNHDKSLLEDLTLRRASFERRETWIHRFKQ